MSVQASIDFKFYSKNGTRISPIDVLFQLLKYEWTCADYHGVSYLPTGDDDDFDWKSERIDHESLIEILKRKEQFGERIGVVMTWRDTLIGGQFLFLDHETVSVLLTVNRQTIVDDTISRHTDVTWYLSRLLPAFSDPGSCFVVESISFSEHV